MIVRQIFDFVDSIFVINLKDLSRKIHVESEFPLILKSSKL